MLEGGARVDLNVARRGVGRGQRTPDCSRPLQRRSRFSPVAQPFKAGSSKTSSPSSRSDETPAIAFTPSKRPKPNSAPQPIQSGAADG